MDLDADSSAHEERIGHLIRLKGPRNTCKKLRIYEQSVFLDVSCFIIFYSLFSKKF